MMKMKNKVKIFIRKTEEWDKLSVEHIPTKLIKSISNQDGTAPLNFEKKCNNFKSNTEYWNRFFTSSWIKFRKQICEISDANLARTRCNKTTRKEIIHSDDFWILPTDDDDWYNPIIKEELEKMPLKLGVVRWRACQYYIRSDTEYFKFFNNNGKIKMTFSNGYAISSKIIKGSNFYLVMDHMAINKANLGDIHFINKELSIHVRHLSSLLFLCLGTLKAKKIETIGKEEKEQLPFELYWAEEERKKIYDLTYGLTT